MTIINEKVFAHTTFFGFCFMTLFILSCAPSTSFKPPNDHRVYLIQKQGDLALIKDSNILTISNVTTSEHADTLLQCDGEAQQLIKEGRRSYEMGKTSQLTAGIPLIGWGIYFKGIALQHSGVAQLVDAMYIHNDQARCIEPTKDYVENMEREEMIIPSFVDILYDSTVIILNGKIRLKCSKTRESLFISAVLLTFDGIVGVDKDKHGYYKKKSIKVKEGDTFYVRTKSLSLHCNVEKTTDDRITISFQKQ